MQSPRPLRSSLSRSAPAQYVIDRRLRHAARRRLALPPVPALSTTALLATLLSATMLLTTGQARADEGMWLIDHPPRQVLAERHDFRADDAWYLHLQRSAVRWPGASGSVVSADGLLMTNYHVAFRQVGKLSTAERNLVAEGFLAQRREDELPCPDLELMVLWEIEDVTEAVRSAVEPEMSAAQAEEARQARRAELEDASEEATGLASEVVTLYGGGLDHLYRYKRFTDVRLVMAPGMNAAFFGGDVDNFEFPRYNIDVAFLRLYENGEPWRAEHYLRLDPTGPEEGELIFAVGHPGLTQRALTVDHLRFLRDVAYPARLSAIWRREVGLELFAQEDAEHRRLAEQSLLGVKNTRKSIGGKLRALQTPRIFARKLEEENELRRRLASDPEHAARWEQAWDTVLEARSNYRQFYTEHQVLERRDFLGSRLFATAQAIVRWVAEREKPSSERLPDYRDALVPGLELNLYSPAPIQVELERHTLEWSLAHLAEVLGAEDPRVVAALAGLPPAERAHQLVSQTTLLDVEARRTLVEGGMETVAASDDPMIDLVRRLDAPGRALHHRYQDEVRSLEQQAYADLADARFVAHGDSVYPDATGTLRLSFGKVAAYQEAGQTVESSTYLSGLFARSAEHAGEPFFDLPPRWQEARERLDLTTPFNFASTLDIVGGSSGSPIVDRDGRVVGIVFDGNRHSLAWDTGWDDHQGRSLGVDIRAIIEVLDRVYGADALLEELMGR